MFAALLLLLSSAHPGLLECGTDATSRMFPGATVMMGPVTPPPTDGSCTCCPVNATIDKYGLVTVFVPHGIFYALRVFGGATIDKPAGPDFGMTANCSSQVYTISATNEGRGHAFNTQTGAPGQELTFATIGWTDGMSGPGMYVVNATLV
jgi:hypothetical protein